MSEQTVVAESRTPERLRGGKAPSDVEPTVAKLVGNFDVLAEASRAVPRLRELVLELAIRGRLLRSADVGHRNQATLGQALTDIPSDWTVVPLGDIAEIVRGITFPASAKTKTAAKGHVACLRTTNVQRSIEWDDLLHVPEEFIARTEQWVREGDLCISMANSYELVGKVAQVVGLNVKATFGGFLGIIRPDARLLPAFLTIFMRSTTIQAELRRGATQTTNIANISLGRLRPLPVSVPPLDEQKRIVARVDQLMALIDDLEAKQTKKRNLSTRFTKASLEALTTAESPEAFDTAWQRVVANLASVIDRAEMVGLLRGALIDLAVSGLLTGAGPGAWSNRSLAEVVTETRYGTSKKCDRDASLTPVLRIPNVVGGALDLTDLKYAAFSDSELVDLSLREGDLLVVRSNGSKDLVGRASVVDARASGFAYAGYLVRLRVDRGLVEPAWIELALRGTRLRAQIENPIRTTTGVHNINTTEILALSLPVPALSEQRAALARIGSFIRLCDDLEAKLRRAEDRASKLVEAVVQEMVA